MQVNRSSVSMRVNLFTNSSLNQLIHGVIAVRVGDWSPKAWTSYIYYHEELLVTLSTAWVLSAFDATVDAIAIANNTMILSAIASVRTYLVFFRACFWILFDIPIGKPLIEWDVDCNHQWHTGNNELIISYGLLITLHKQNLNLSKRFLLLLLTYLPSFHGQTSERGMECLEETWL